MQRGSGKRVRDEFYTKLNSESNTYVCKCGCKRKVSGHGYTNLVDHVRRDHPDELRDFLAAVGKGEVSISSASTKGHSIFFRKQTVHLHGWIHFVVMGLQPFSIVSNPVLCQHTKYDTITLPTLNKYLGRLTKAVEVKISKLLPEKFSIVLDGWTSSSTHYVAIFATFPSDSEINYDKILLGFSPFESEESQDSESHVNFINYVLSVFDKSVANVVAMTGDNCNTNKKMAKLLNCKFVGCHSHRFNLSVQKLAEPDSNLISTVRKLMQKLSTPIPAAKLRAHTDLSAASDCVTRWSSTAKMLKRCIELRDFLCKLDDDDLEKLIPTVSQYRKIEKLSEKFSDLDSVTTVLQKESISLADARSLFETVLEEYPNMADRLSSTAKIIHDPTFESAICKILNKEFDRMSESERNSVRHLLLEENVSHNEEHEDFSTLSLGERGLKKRKLLGNSSKYMDVRFIRPTSNISERLFSTAGYALSDRRKDILPMNFERQIFIHGNTKLWGISDVNSLVNMES